MATREPRRAAAGESDWLTLGQAAKYLGVAQSTIRKWSDLGRVPSSRTQKTLLDQHRHVMIDPIRWLDEAAKWEKIWTDLFLK